ncbi:hypothetical protein GN958_ATG16943 [Phytophthora infestans]|uniref:Uncharacterized protein n=1 Tax=Phytophthora infestans TaxID=4787 RepID=A0A8S9TY60_PHYIN|nr:hypothetical protein GN958_ATG16943 [Phytophthora infestans]
MLHGHRFQQLVVDVAAHGVPHILNSPRESDTPPARAHRSATLHERALLRSLAEGQSSGTYWGIDLPVALRWSEVRFSPFGCVPKNNIDLSEEARLIHDLSHPGDSSTNDRSTYTRRTARP